MGPASKFCGDAGVVGTLIFTSALPVHTPVVEIMSPLCTSDRKILLLLLTLCKLINTPLRNSETVSCPIPDINVTSISAAAEVEVTVATSDLLVIFGASCLVDFFGLLSARVDFFFAVI